MKKLTIFGINNYVYLLRDDYDNDYSLNLEFINLDKKIETNDVIYLDEDLLKERSFYTFGPFNSEYGRNIESEKDKDIAVLELKQEKIYLKRYYG